VGQLPLIYGSAVTDRGRQSRKNMWQNRHYFVTLCCCDGGFISYLSFDLRPSSVSFLFLSTGALQLVGEREERRINERGANNKWMREFGSFLLFSLLI